MLQSKTLALNLVIFRQSFSTKPYKELPERGLVQGRPRGRDCNIRFTYLVIVLISC